ncbi:MAG: hypothetical protein WB660_30855, partial [Candidatus Sulfotelmatobacter sp.]
GSLGLGFTLGNWGGGDLWFLSNSRFATYPLRYRRRGRLQCGQPDFVGHGEIRVPLPENLLVKWRSQTGCGLNLSTVTLTLIPIIFKDFPNGKPA